jgi:hypothetical protein
MGLIQLTEEHVAALGTSTLTEFTWSTVSGFKGLENDVVLLVGVSRPERNFRYFGSRPIEPLR